MTEEGPGRPGSSAAFIAVDLKPNTQAPVSLATPEGPCFLATKNNSPWENLVQLFLGKLLGLVLGPGPCWQRIRLWGHGWHHPEPSTQKQRPPPLPFVFAQGQSSVFLSCPGFS